MRRSQNQLWSWVDKEDGLEDAASDRALDTDDEGGAFGDRSKAKGFWPDQEESPKKKVKITIIPANAREAVKITLTPANAREEVVLKSVEGSTMHSTDGNQRQGPLQRDAQCSAQVGGSAWLAEKGRDFKKERSEHLERLQHHDSQQREERSSRHERTEVDRQDHGGVRQQQTTTGDRERHQSQGGYRPEVWGADVWAPSSTRFAQDHQRSHRGTYVPDTEVSDAAQADRAREHTRSEHLERQARYDRWDREERWGRQTRPAVRQARPYDRYDRRQNDHTGNTHRGGYDRYDSRGAYHGYRDGVRDATRHFDNRDRNDRYGSAWHKPIKQ